MKTCSYVFLSMACALALSQANPGHAQLTEQTMLVAGDAMPFDVFGSSVSISGTTLLIGAPLDDPLGGTDRGSAYVFVCSPSWSQQAKLTASDAADSDQFGTSVSISGNTALVGAPNGDIGGGVFAGSAYVFVRTGTSWSQQAKLTASDAANYDSFGASVALSGDVALVGAWHDDFTGGLEAGSAYVFVRTGTSWSQQAKLTSSDYADYDSFGYSVAVSGDTALVGANHDAYGTGGGQGSAYVFVRSGTSWSEQAKLTASDATDFAVFGWSVALEGNNALVGAPLGRSFLGSAYVFVRTGTSWSEQQELSATGDPGGFGHAVSLSGDIALVGASSDDNPGGTDAGSAFEFTRSGTVWTEQVELLPSNPASFFDFGACLALSGKTALVGWYADLGSPDPEAAYLYCLSSATALPYSGDGINADVLSASPATLGSTWTASVAIGHTHGASGPLVLKVRSSTFNGPNFSAPLGGRLTEVLVGGPFLASLGGSHNGVTGSFPAQTVPVSLCGVPWAAQATVVGGGFADLSTAVSGIVGQ